MKKVFSIEIGGHEMTFETGCVAKQANGSIVARAGYSGFDHYLHF